MRKVSNEFDALISKLQLDNDEMSIETYIQMEGENIIELEMSIDELVDAVLGINQAQGFDLNVETADHGGQKNRNGKMIAVLFYHDFY
jgi:hypothetical protein